MIQDGLKRLMDELSISVARISKESGISKNNLYAYLRGAAHPTEGVILQLSYTLGVSTDELLAKEAYDYEMEERC